MTETNPTELAANSAENHPETLRTTVGAVESMVVAAVTQLDTDGPAEKAVCAFSNVADVRQLLTDRRLERMRSIMPTPPDNISDLADRLGGNYSDVHVDVTVLADHEIVYFDTDG